MRKSDKTSSIIGMGLLTIAVALIVVQVSQKPKSTDIQHSVFYGGNQEWTLEEALADVEKYPQLHDTHFKLASKYSFLNQHDKAALEFAKALEIEPAKLNTMAALGVELCLNGETDRAWAYYAELETAKFSRLSVAKDFFDENCPKQGPTP